MDYRMEICQQIADIPEDDWNSMLRRVNQGHLHPALRHEFLKALEESGSVSAETGWGPVHLVLKSHQGQVLAAMPMYIKSHSYGEYVFDWSWAQAYERHGLRYYPKLLSAIPFTPVSAPKLLCLQPEHGVELAQRMAEFALAAASSTSVLGTRVSSLHALFLSENDQSTCLNRAALPGAALPIELDSRHCVQFHLHNLNPETQRPFKDFEDYLQSLSQKKRKNIRAERRKVMEGGVSITRLLGTQASESDIEFFYHCYAQTYAEHVSTPYLNLDFFRRIFASMGEQIVLVKASQSGQDIASSLLLFNQDRLYGRYWGAMERVPCLHFEMCYYQAIEFVIENQINWFEGGAQGEHKMARGLNPCTQVSAHWVFEEGFKDPIKRFLERERNHLQHYVSELEEHTAFKNQADFL